MVSIICCTIRDRYMHNVFRNYNRQKVKKKEMIVVLNHDDMNARKWRRAARKYANVKIYQVPESYELGRCLNYGIRKAKYNIIAKFDDDDYYAPDYLAESLSAIKKRTASVVGKKTSYMYFEDQRALMLYRRNEENKYCGKLKGGTLVFRKSVWKKVKFDEKRKYGSDAHFLKKCKRKGFKLYSVSKSNYVCMRRKDTSTHTQKRSVKKFMSLCRMIRRTDDYASLISKRYPFARKVKA